MKATAEQIEKARAAAEKAKVPFEVALKTYDIHFNDAENSNNKGFKMTIDQAKDYIKSYNETNESYFADYKGGTVSIVDNETGESVYEEQIN